MEMYQAETSPSREILSQANPRLEEIMGEDGGIGSTLILSKQDMQLYRTRLQQKQEYESRKPQHIQQPETPIPDAKPPIGTDFYLIDALLTEEERTIRDLVHTFAQQEIIPVINDYWQRDQFPFDLVPKIARLRLAGGTIQGYGCPGMSSVAAGLMMMEWARGDSSMCTFFGVHSFLAMNSIALCGSEEQKERWLPAMAKMGKLGAFALTEPNHGSDVISLETQARRVGNKYVLNGAKRWIVNANFADVVVVWARDEKGKVGAFLVERGTPGFEAKVIPGRTAKRAIWLTDIKLKDVVVPEYNRLANARSFQSASQVLASTRFIVSWEAIGHAVAAYEIALAYSKERMQFGKTLASFQIIQNKLANMLAKVTSMQLLSLRLSQLLDEGQMTGAMAALAKMNNARLAREVIAEAREMLGANGIVLDNHIARYHADIEGVFTYDGTDTIQSLIVGQEITGKQAFAPR
jgi:glutaryl-CoA dehydrogenase